MADRISALAQVPAFAGAVTLSEAPYSSILQIRAWPDTLATVQAVVISTLLDEDGPPLGSAISRGDAVVAAAGSGRLMIASTVADLAQQMATALPADDAAVSDLSHGRTVLALEGAAAAAILSKCVAIDLDLAAFPPGRVAETMIHHIDVLIHRQSETRFELWVLRSFAESLAEWLLDQGIDDGIGFRR